MKFSLSNMLVEALDYCLKLRKTSIRISSEDPWVNKKSDSMIKLSQDLEFVQLWDHYVQNTAHQTEWLHRRVRVRYPPNPCWWSLTKRLNWTPHWVEKNIKKYEFLSEKNHGSSRNTEWIKGAQRIWKIKIKINQVKRVLSIINKLQTLSSSL